MTDPDVGDVHTISVSDPRFEIVNNVLKLKAGVSLDYETEHVVFATLGVTDQGGLSDSLNFAISVNNVLDPE